MKQESGAKSSIPILDEVTVVTAYINIGSFQKGSSKHQNFTTDLYYHWMETFSQMNNPVVAFFDHKQDAEIFKKIRGNKMNSTQVVIFNETLHGASVYYNAFNGLYQNQIIQNIIQIL